jgi:hypothetical protein
LVECGETRHPRPELMGHTVQVQSVSCPADVEGARRDLCACILLGYWIIVEEKGWHTK